jgi:hypothetical protein
VRIAEFGPGSGPGSASSAVGEAERPELAGESPSPSHAEVA